MEKLKIDPNTDSDTIPEVFCFLGSRNAEGVVIIKYSPEKEWFYYEGDVDDLISVNHTAKIKMSDFILMGSDFKKLKSGTEIFPDCHRPAMLAEMSIEDFKKKLHSICDNLGIPDEWVELEYKCCEALMVGNMMGQILAHSIAK